MTLQQQQTPSTHMDPHAAPQTVEPMELTADQAQREQEAQLYFDWLERSGRHQHLVESFCNRAGNVGCITVPLALIGLAVFPSILGPFCIIAILICLFVAPMAFLVSALLRREHVRLLERLTEFLGTYTAFDRIIAEINRDGSWTGYFPEYAVNHMLRYALDSRPECITPGLCSRLANMLGAAAYGKDLQITILEIFSRHGGSEVLPVLRAATAMNARAVYKPEVVDAALSCLQTVSKRVSRGGNSTLLRATSDPLDSPHNLVRTVQGNDRHELPRTISTEEE